MLRPLQPEHGEIGKEHPVQKAGVIDPDPGHQAEGEPEALPKAFRPGDQRAGQQDRGKDQDAEALCQQHVFRAVRNVDALVCFEIFLLDIRRIVVDAHGAVFSVSAIIGKDDGRKHRCERKHLQQNDPPNHFCCSFPNALFTLNSLVRLPVLSGRDPRPAAVDALAVILVFPAI